ncbi:MAG: hypothetical protein IJ576_09890 [Synergistaceae bacterium]|nr:hypothetical protein [Synergistaceae bacterium]
MMINTNIPALRAYNLLDNTANALNKSVLRLASGKGVNSAADDAAGLSISEQMNSQIVGMDKASQNSQNVISLLQTAEGALGDTQGILDRMRELAVYATSDTLTSNDREFIQLEINDLRAEINHIAETTHFNTKKLLDGSPDALWSSSSLNLKANINGSIAQRDEFGNIVNNSEGNYIFQIAAVNPGKSQILKSNILETVPEDDASNTLGFEYIRNFLTLEGKYMLENPQTLKITQGDDKSANVTLYKHDTLDAIAKKINDAIAYGLGQAAYADNPDNFAVIASGSDNTSEAVANTLVVRSIIPGKAGELTFAGRHELIEALGFNTLQASSESEFTVSVKDAHTGEYLNNFQDIKITGNKIQRVIHDNIDVEFGAMTGITAEWDDLNKKYDVSRGVFTGMIHIADNGLTFQTGANSGESTAFDMGSISARNLGIEDVNVATRESAAKSVMLIDSASDKIITQRTRIGGYIGSLDRNIENLSNASSHLNAARSRIIDADMAKEAVSFVKLKILADSGASVLAQANQVPEAVIRLFN